MNKTIYLGHVNSQVYFGLFYKDQIVSCLSLRKPIQKKYGNCLEIARFANSLQHVVQGGFQKLFKQAIKYCRDSGFDSVLTYADLRHGDGKTYLNSGFKFVGKTRPDYWYTNGIIREFRFKYRANSGKTEKEISNEAGVEKFYGCGSNIYLYKI